MLTLTRAIGPLLLGYDTLKENHELGEAWKELPRHRDEDQVRLDVNRAFVYYPTSRSTMLFRSDTCH